MRPTPTRSTAEIQRARIIASAVTVFARTGFHATPVAEVAKDAGISPAYVFRLFTDKLGLFVAALDDCHERVRQAMEHGATNAKGKSAAQVLEAMGGAYAELIADRDLLMLQVHAQSACDVPEIRAAVRRGLQDLTAMVHAQSGAKDEEIQRLFAYGQLCHLIVTADLHESRDAWARPLTTGMRHPAAKPKRK